MQELKTDIQLIIWRETLKLELIFTRKCIYMCAFVFFLLICSELLFFSLNSSSWIKWKNDREEMACDEAELEPDEFAEKMHNQQQLHEKVGWQPLFPIFIENNSFEYQEWLETEWYSSYSNWRCWNSCASYIRMINPSFSRRFAVFSFNSHSNENQIFFNMNYFEGNDEQIAILFNCCVN